MPKKKVVIPADPPELLAVNKSVPWTDGDISGKVVIIRKAILSPEYQLMDRRFRAGGGFGTKLDTMGSAVFGTWLADGEESRQERHHVEGIAVNPDLPVVHYGNV